MAIINRDDTMATRAGRYVQQITGYSTFIPILRYQNI